MRRNFWIACACACVAATGRGEITSASIITRYGGASWLFNGDAPGLKAPVYNPISMSPDVNGDIIFADLGNHVVSRINRDGTISAIAGNGLEGFSGDGGAARHASMRRPSSVVMNSRGVLYIFDSGNLRIRRVGPEGIISTFAGTGVAGHAGDGGPAIKATIGSGARLAVDHQDRLYLTDPEICVIRRIDENGTITRFAGTGTCGHSGDGQQALSAQIDPTGGITFDVQGNLYVAEVGRLYVRRIAASGVVSTFAGTGRAGNSGDGGPATAATFRSPRSLAFDAAGNLYVADTNSFVVRRIAPNGTITTFAGSGGFASGGDGGPPLRASFLLANAVALDGSGAVYVADAGSFTIRRITGNVINTIVGNGQFRSVPDGVPFTSGYLFGPEGLYFDPAGNLNILETGFSKAVQFTRNGTFFSLAGTGGRGGRLSTQPAKEALLAEPRGMAFDKDGSIFISDSGANIVYKLTPDGRLGRYAGQLFVSDNTGDGGTALNATLRFPAGLAIDAAGNLYIADRDSHVIRRVTPAGGISTFAGTGAAGYNGDNRAAATAQFNRPFDLLFDASGNLLVSDVNNHRIRAIDPAGNIRTIAGNGRAANTGDRGAAVSASVNGPLRMALDRTGNVYFVCSAGRKLRKIDAAGVITTIAGDENFLVNTGDGGAAGPATLAVNGVAADAAGNVYLSSFDNNIIRRILAQEPGYNVSASGLSFSATSGGRSADPQTVAIGGEFPGLQFEITPDAPWIKLDHRRGHIPFSLAVTADPANLEAGSYQGKIRFTRLGSSTPFAVIDVSFAVADAVRPRLAVEPASIAISTTAGLSAGPQQTLRVLNAGGGSFDFNISTGGAGSESVTLSAVDGSAAAGVPVPVGVRLDSSNLAPGTYSLQLTVSASNGESATVPVFVSVSPRVQRLALSQRGFLFTGVLGGGVTPPQSFAVLNTGGGTLNWEAKTTTSSGGPGWLSVSPASGTSTPGDVAPGVAVRVDASVLPNPGVYYGRVRVTSPEAADSPQDVQVVLNLLTADSAPGTVVSPSGLLFTAVAGDSDPGSQTFTITNLNASAIQTSLAANTFLNVPWLTATAGAEVIALEAGASQAVTVQPSASELTPGIYFGNVNVIDGATTKVVNVVFVVTAPAQTAQTARAKVRSEGACMPAQLVPLLTSVLDGFSVPAAWPVALEAKVVDDCGAPVSSGSVVVSFSNGDPPINLSSLNDGRWQGTWFGRSTRVAQMVVTLNAAIPAARLNGSRRYTGVLFENPEVPAVTSGGVVTARGVQGGASVLSPVAPGSIVAIEGRNLAFAPVSSLALPLDYGLAGNSAVLAGVELPLISTSSGRIVAVVPYNLSPGQYQVAIARGTAVSGPEPVTVAAAQPGILRIEAAAEPSGLGDVWNSVVNGTSIEAGATLKPGDPFVIICTGLGALESQADPAAATAGDIRTQQTAAVTIGGTPVPVSASTLSSAFPGVYVVKAAVPSGFAAGTAVPVIVTVGGQASGAVNVNVQ